MSGNSWANMGQECIKCHINVYPHKQVSRAGLGTGRQRLEGLSEGSRGRFYSLLGLTLLLHVIRMRPDLSKLALCWSPLKWE